MWKGKYSSVYNHTLPNPVKVLKQLQQVLPKYVHLKKHMQLGNLDQRKNKKEDIRDIDWKKSPQGAIPIFNGNVKFAIRKLLSS